MKRSVDAGGCRKVVVSSLIVTIYNECLRYEQVDVIKGDDG